MTWWEWLIAAGVAVAVVWAIAIVGVVVKVFKRVFEEL